MGSEWPRVRLGDHVDITVGPAFASEHFRTSPPGVRLARGDNVTEGRFRWGDKTRYWPSITPDLARYLLAEGDILLGMDGSRVGRNWTEVRAEDLPCLLVQRVACLRPRPTLTRRFLAALVSTSAFKAHINAYRTGSSIPHISASQIGEFGFGLPPIAEQESIGRTLGTLDDKIELNRRMSQTLDSTARALFKSWFVDFDPVRAKVEGLDPGLSGPLASLFPDSFEDSELGEIPAGWKVESLGVLGQIAIGGVWGEEVSFSGAVSAVCLRGVDLEHLRLDGSAKAPRRWFKPSSLNSRQLDERDVLIAASGAGPTGRPLWMSPVLAGSLGLSTYSNFCKRIRCSSPTEAIYLDTWLQVMRESGEVWEYVNGTSIPNLDVTSLLANKLVVVPSRPILERYGSFLGSIWDAKYSRRDTALATLRDGLLAGLMGFGGSPSFSKDSATAQLGRST
jgi:type I restriction enzyme S subunit